MPQKSRRKARAEPKRAERAEAKGAEHSASEQSPNQPQAQPAALANPFQPMGVFMQAFTPLAWFRPWITAPVSAAPKLDVIDRDGSLLVRAEVPGVQKSHLAVEASDVAVTIKGEIGHDDGREEDRYRIAETARGVFERTVRLPSDVDSTRAKATFKDGVVEVMLPKVDRSRSHHVKF